MNYKVCEKCGIKKQDSDFFSLKEEGTSFDRTCKDCVCDELDIRDMAAIEKIVKEMNIPFVEKMWIETANQALIKGAKGSKSVLGRYLRIMNMWQYKDKTYADSEQMTKEYNKRHPENVRIVDGQEQYVGDVRLSENDARIYSDLTPEDLRYLTVKWGGEYLPSEWVQMEDMYNKYEQEYEMNVDRRETLVLMCKTNLKMNQMLSEGNIADYQKLANVLKDLRTTGKFTDSQKVEKRRYIDSIGELVAFCEREGGIIPQFEDPDEYPKDTVDFTIQDMKAYTYNLVANEMGLGSIIEMYIKKLEEADAEIDMDPSSFITSGEEADEEYLNDITALEWQQYLENGIDDDIEELLRQVKPPKE